MHVPAQLRYVTLQLLRLICHASVTAKRDGVGSSGGGRSAGSSGGSGGGVGTGGGGVEQ